MRDKTHNDQIERWALEVKKNPDWKNKLKPFIDSQINNSIEKYNKILQLPNGEDKLNRIRKIKC